MNCKTAKRNMDLLVFERELTPDEGLSEHLLICSSCSRYLEESMEAKRIMEELRRSEPRLTDPAQLTDSILETVKALEAHPRTRPAAGFRPRLRLMAVERILAAASVCLILVFGFEQYTVVNKITRLEDQAQMDARKPGLPASLQAVNTAGLSIIDIKKAIRFRSSARASSYGLLQKRLDKIGNP